MKISKLTIEDATRIYGVTTTADEHVAVALCLDTHENVIRIYESMGGEHIHQINKDSNGKPWLSKPQYIITAGELENPWRNELNCGS